MVGYIYAVRTVQNTPEVDQDLMCLFYLVLACTCAHGNERWASSSLAGTSMAVQLQEVLQAKALQWNTSFSVGIVSCPRLSRLFLFSFQLV